MIWLKAANLGRRVLIPFDTAGCWNPVGSCKMGADDMAVVDQHLRVRGVEGLRVIDASIMPTLISGNTQAPSIMIGEKGAHHIVRGDAAPTEAASSKPTVRHDLAG